MNSKEALKEFKHATYLAVPDDQVQNIGMKRAKIVELFKNKKIFMLDDDTSKHCIDYQDIFINKTTNEEQEVYYVLRNRMGYKDKILVKVLKQNDFYAIISNYTNEELKTNIGFSDEEIKQVKTIVLYDEIIINSST